MKSIKNLPDKGRFEICYQLASDSKPAMYVVRTIPYGCHKYWSKEYKSRSEAKAKCDARNKQLITTKNNQL